MSKASPPLLGFNNNVRHRGRIFHIQTEDSGVKFPRIVTHLFADGGRIIKTTRTDYTQHLTQSDMATVVRALMKEQHKAMFSALRGGQLDALLENVCGPLEPAQVAPVSVALDPTAKNDLESSRVVVAAERGAQAPSAGGEPPPAPKRGLANPNLQRPTPSVTPPAPEAFSDLDVASIDDHPPKSARPAPSVPPPRRPNPPPRKSRPPIPTRATSPAAPKVAAAVGAPAPVDNAGSRSSTRIATAPQTTPRSIFGDGAISEQSLDEVILSYLAEDLDDSK